MNGQGQIQNLPVEAVYQALGSTMQGLAPAEAADRLREVGRNSVEVRDRWHLLRSLVHLFTNFFTLLLFASAGICFVAEYLQSGQSMMVLGWALAGVALLNALFSFIQQYRAERAMEALRQFLPPMVEVVRGGQTLTLHSEELVPGDVLLLKEGDRVPADTRLVAVEDLVVNNAPLTGESLPVPLTAEPVEQRLVESNNIAFTGCLVLRGSAQGVVFATGLRTEFGKLAHLSQALRRSVSPLEEQTAHMVRILTIIAVSLGFSFFLYGMLSGRSVWVNLVFMMGIIVANVPEGLLPTFTLALALGSQRMARRNVLVTSLNAVESLGAVQVICTDKTGTLTRNQLAVTCLASAGSDPETLAAESRRRLLELALCTCQVHQTDQGYSGDLLDIAVVERANAELLETEKILSRTRKHFPFDVTKKRAAGIGELHGQPVFATKGAWEVLRHMLVGLEDSRGAICPADQATLNRAEAIMTDLAASGLRVVAVAYHPVESDSVDQSDQEMLEEELILAGFLGIEDALREEVPGALASCHAAGIEVVLITGDHPSTAMNVAERCGLIDQGAPPELVMTGDVLENLTEEELIASLQTGIRIFARTSPAQKMKIVMAFKAMDRIVAMTGDGVNDAPALKAADVGIAMGKSGTDVARASAQVVLLDDNFASIVAGIEEGRAVFHNIQKFTNYVLVSNGPEILPYLLYILFPVPLALTVIQILSIDLGTDIIPSMALGQEPPDPESMHQPPRGHDFRLLSPGLVVHSYLFLGLLEALWSLGLFFYVLIAGGWSYGAELAVDDPLYRSATGIALATILLMQIGNLLGRRYTRQSGLDRGIFRNRLMLIGIVIQIVFSWGVLYLEPLQTILGTGPVDISIYFVAWLGAPLIFGADLLRKRLSFGTDHLLA